MTRELSFDEERAMELYAQGHTDADIAGELGVKRTTICNWRQRRGLQRNLPPLMHGTRPEVTVEVPPGLMTFNERKAAEAMEIKTAPVSLLICFRGYEAALSAPDVEHAREGVKALAAAVEALAKERRSGT